MVSLFSVADGIFNPLHIFSLYCSLPQSRGPASEKSITRRADRLLNDLAVTLAEDHISLRRPGSGTGASEEGTSNDISSVAPKSAESARGRAVRSHGYSAPTKGSHSNKDLQSVGTDEGVALSKETESGGHTVEEATEGKMTSLENSATQLAVSCFGDNFVQGSPNKLREVYENTDLPAVNSYDADTCLNARKGSASPKVEPFNLSSEDHDFTTIERNATFIVNDFEKTNKLELNETTASTKTSELASVGQLGQANSKTEIFHAVDMEFSSDDTSSGVLQSSKTFCCAGNLNYTENETDNPKANEDNIKKASHCVTADEVEIKTSEAGNIMMNNTGSHLLYTEQSIYGTEVSQRSSDTLKHEGCKMVERGYDSSLKRTLPPVKKERIDDFCTEQELLIFRSSCVAVDPGNGKQEVGKTQNDQHSDEAYVVKHFGSSPRDINNKEHAIVNVNSRMQIVKELDDALSDASYQEKKILHTGESHAEFTQVAFDHDTEDSHVYKAKREKCNMKDAKMYTSNMAEVNAVESIDGTEQEGNNGEGIGSVYEGKEEAHGIGQEVNNGSIVSVFNDIKKEIHNTAEGKNDNYSKNGGQCEERPEFDDHKHQAKIYGENTEDGLHNKEDSENSQRKGNMESNSENDRIDAFDPKQDGYGAESDDVTSCVDNAFQERRVREGTDSNKSNKDQKCDDEELVFNNTESECVTLKGLRSPSQKSRECNGYVTQQEMHSFQQLQPGGKAKDSHATNNGALNMSSTEDKDLNKESCNLDDANFCKEELSKTAVFSNVLNKQHERLKTKDSSLEVNPQEKVDNSKTAEADVGVTETRYCSSSSTIPCQSNAVVRHSPRIPGGANTSSTLSLNTCFSDQIVRRSHHLVPENFDNVDMEISSDEEHHHHGSSNSIVRVDDDGNARYNDASTPYSPSSPTRKSDEQCSPPPPPKDDSSPYSPSHPTNVSEGDVEHNDPVKELCYDDNEGERVVDVCETRKEMINSDRLENSFEANKVAKNGSAPNIAALNHVINTDSVGVNTVSSPRDFSSPKPNSGSSQRVSLSTDFVDLNASAEDLAQYGRKNTSDEYDKYDGSNSTVCIDKFTGDDSNNDTRKPVMRCPRRTQSVPSFTSGAPKPEVVYITATKRKHVHGESGSQSKPQILYITEDKAVPKSLSLDEPPRKQRPFVLTPTHDCRSTERRTVMETERQKVENCVRHVEPLLTECSYESDRSLKPGNKDTGDDDNGKDNRVNTEPKVNMAWKTATTTDIAVPTAEVGSGAFALGGVTDNTSSIDKQQAASFAREQQDSLVKPSGAVLKDKTISFVSVTPLARDTLYKGSDVDNEGVNFLSNKHENEREDLRVFPTSLTMARDVTEIRSTNVDKDIGKAINNNNGKLYNGIPCSTITSTIDEDHIPLGSARKNKTLLSQVPLKIREKESQYCHTAATTYHAQGQTTELPSYCNCSAGRSVKDVNGDYSYGPVQMQMKSEMAVKRTSPALEITAFENSSSRTVLLVNGACSEGTVQEEDVMNTKRDLDNQTLSNVSSRFANKRPHRDTSNEAPHPYKVPRKPLKLLIPNRDGKIAAKQGEKCSRKTSSCTITSADLNVAPGSNGLRASEMINTGIVDMLVDDSGNVNGNEMTTLLSSPTTKTSNASNRASSGTSKLGWKTTSCTVTCVDLDFVPGSDGLAINGKNPGAIEERLKFKTTDSVGIELLTALSPRSSNAKQAEGKGLCQGDNLSPVITGNMSPLSAHFAGYNQHDGLSLVSVKDVNIEEQRAKEDKANFVRKESEWIACKMERLRKKKEEIEQVTYFSNFL